MAQIKYSFNLILMHLTYKSERNKNFDANEKPTLNALIYHISISSPPAI